MRGLGANRPCMGCPLCGPMLPRGAALRRRRRRPPDPAGAAEMAIAEGEGRGRPGPTRERIVKLALHQGPSPAGDVERALAAITRAAAFGAGMVLFPELYLPGYNQKQRLRDLAEPVDGPALARVRAIARETGVAIVTGFAEREASGCRIRRWPPPARLPPHGPRPRGPDCQVITVSRHPVWWRPCAAAAARSAARGCGGLSGGGRRRAGEPGTDGSGAA